MNGAVGYPGLLNLGAQPHWTVFLSDFALPPAVVRRLQRQLDGCPTRPLFIRIDHGVKAVMHSLEAAGVDAQNDYLSLQGLAFQHQNVFLLDELYESLPRRDLARLELPLAECGFQPSLAGRLIETVAQADYDQQDRIADRFFHLLARRKPYRVTVLTGASKLEVRDSAPWFDIAGKLQDSETRILPAGEVAYTADRIDGQFLIDGAILPLPEHPEVAEEALVLMRLSSEVSRDPVRVHIRAGKIVGISGRGKAPAVLTKLAEREPRYRHVTEVGISFNRASRRFIHAWTAASNEVRPGVHIGIGGDPTPNDGETESDHPLVHIDCMTANCEVLVNGQPFLRASS